MAIGIVGSRKFKNLNLVSEFIDQLPPNTEVVSGGARGVDTVAAKTARHRGLTVYELKPDYDKYPNKKIAPLERNTEIVNRSFSIVAFWDGESTGTADTIKKAIALNKPVLIIDPEGRKTFVNDFRIWI